MKIKLEKVFIKNICDIKKFTEFYNQIFVPSFSNQDDCENLEFYTSLIKKGKFKDENCKENCKSHIILYSINKFLVGGIIYYKFIYYNIISRLIIKEEFRNQGIGTFILEDFFEKNSKTPTFLEINKCNKKLYEFWKKRDFRIIDFNFKHPNFNNQKEVDLFLCVREKHKAIINKIFLKEFVYDFSKNTIGIEYPKKNNSILNIYKNIDKKKYIRILDDEDVKNEIHFN